MKNIIQRGFAFYIDALIFSFPAFLFYKTIFLNINGSSYSRYDDYKPLFIQIICSIIYFTLCEYFFKTTLGKWLFNFEVIKKDSSIRIINVLKRSFFRIIPINQISFLFNDEQIFWHERWSRIYTVKKGKTS